MGFAAPRARLSKMRVSSVVHLYNSRYGKGIREFAFDMSKVIVAMLVMTVLMLWQTEALCYLQLRTVTGKL